MNQIEFIKLVGEIRNNCGLDCNGPNYYIFIHKDLTNASVNQTGYTMLTDKAFIIVVCAYNWSNWGYTNTSLTQLLMVDTKFDPIDGIRFGSWIFRGLQFTRHYGQFYNAWRPLPKLELISNSLVNNFVEKPYDAPEYFPEWEWPCVDINNITELFRSIHEFSQKFPI